MDELLKNSISKTFPLKRVHPPSLTKSERQLFDRWKTGFSDVLSRDSTTSETVQLCKKEKIYGLEIPPEHGGLGTSSYLHSLFLQYLVTVDRNANWIHRIMVPNSLGPAQLLLKYGTSQQKSTYLPKLASGEITPCFGLTGPFNGSDAAAFPKDENAEIFVNDDNTEYLRFSCHKRWITLSPISDLLGLAIRIQGKISLVLVDLKTLSPEQRCRITIKKHQPIGSSFPNGEIVIKDLEIPVDCVIGGKENIGQGWKMLMECLHHGRGISLPSISDGGSRSILWHTLWYSLVRNQFQQPLFEIPAVKSSIADMTVRVFLGKVVNEFYHALLQHSASGSGSHEGSGAMSAVMKWVTTTWHREVMLNGMDIFAGRGITLGPRNPIAHYYLQNPIPITVEGSNPLTLHVIIPMQTIFEHISLFQETAEALEKNDSLFFYKTVGKIGWSIQRNIGKFLIGSYLERKTAYTILLAYYSLLQGKSLRSNQALSGTLGRAITGCVVLHALEWYHIHNTHKACPKEKLNLEEIFLVAFQFTNDYFFSKQHTPRTMMHSFDPETVHATASFFLRSPQHLRFLEEDIDLSKHTNPCFHQTRDLWVEIGSKADTKTFYSSLPRDLQKEMVTVDAQ